ncbi:MAG: FAD binding domain-containing protein [Ilumatobacteraceae bacterium]|nr:FAD binding domain-containing protein [Ilumatobacteraceae bacterium]MDP4936229.1 FAD binding domain-containing protein [Ilumatobacteraceae bacterium]MDP5114089.1 FAD binding domain-containing protein [Ilumatobacteraceae bacterium]
MPVLIPRNVDELIDVFQANPQAKLLAGGTDYMVEVNLHGRKPDTMISLRQVKELTEWSVRPSQSRITIGAGVPYAEMEVGEIARLVPALAQAARTVGSPQIRAAGTLGGNLGTCSPAGDSLPVLAALNATIHVIGPDGNRDIDFVDFMVGVKKNSLQPAEFVHSVSMPIVDGWQGYAKVGTRNAMVISTASACLVRDSDEGFVSIALGSVGPTIIRAHNAEAWLMKTTSLRASAQLEPSVAQEFGRRVALESRPIDDHRSTADYRRHAIGVLAQRLLTRSFS